MVLGSCVTKYVSHGPTAAKDIAEHLEVPNFKASNGWLDRWKRRYNVKKMKINGEAGDVSGETVDSWKERLPELLQGYS